MKTSTVLILAGFGGLILYKYAGLAVASNDLNISFNSIDISNFPNANVSILAQNVTNTPITINALVANLTAQNSQVGTLSLFNPVTIAATSQTVINLNFTASVFGLPTAVINTITNATGNLTFNIQGNINVQSIPAPIPFNITQNFVSSS